MSIKHIAYETKTNSDKHIECHPICCKDTAADRKLFLKFKTEI